MVDSLRGTGVTMHIVRPGFVRSKMTKGMTEVPFTTDVDEVANTVMKGIANHETVIMSPPVLRYIFVVMVHLPGVVWRKLNENR
jgi:decaprenylphospho-beta-D-erythro-pentofuranosid-2-ulose 2-reductase